jgi:hypothetical protein
MFITVTMSYLISASAWGLLVYDRAGRESRNVIAVIGGIFSVVSVWSCVDLEPRTVAYVQKCYSVPLDKVNADGQVLTVEK